MTKVHIVLPVHNRLTQTLQFIACLKLQSYSHYHLLVIDDHSTDGTAEKIKDVFPKATLLYGDGNLWWGGALQKAYRWLGRQAYAPDDVVLLINNDVVFENDFLSQGVAIIEAQPKTLLLAYAYDAETHEIIDSGIRIDWRRLRFTPKADMLTLNCLSTRGLFLSLSNFLDIGPFHPVLLPHFFSDYEYTYRAFRKGYRLMSSDNLKVYTHRDSSWNIGKNQVTVSYNIKSFFSKRNPSNPLHLSAFLLLACPFPWKITHLITTWLLIPVKVFLFLLKRLVPLKKAPY